MKNAEFIDQLKPRFSWGKMGNQAVSLYSYLSSVNTSGYDYSFDGTKYGGAAISALADNTITWEETTSYDAGIDFSAFGNRVLFSADWFLKRTEGILRTVNLPSQVGDLSGPKSNVGVVDNKGIELSLTLRDSWGDFSAGISGNFSYTRNEIVDLNGETEINGRLICKEGYPINSWYLLETDGVFQNQSEIDNAQAVYGNRANLRPGYVKYVNQNNDNTIDGNDRVIAGNTIPRFAYGFNLNFGWKGFAVEAQFQGVGDVSVYPSSNMAFGLYNGAGLTKQWVRDSWSATNRNTEYPLLTTYPRSGRELPEFDAMASGRLLPASEKHPTELHFSQAARRTHRYQGLAGLRQRSEPRHLLGLQDLGPRNFDLAGQLVLLPDPENHQLRHQPHPITDLTKTDQP